MSIQTLVNSGRGHITLEITSHHIGDHITLEITSHWRTHHIWRLCHLFADREAEVGPRGRAARSGREAEVGPRGRGRAARPRSGREVGPRGRGRAARKRSGRGRAASTLFWSLKH